MKTQEEFDSAEKRWRTQLSGRALVIEATADPLEAEQALAILGSNYRRATTKDAKKRFLNKYRAAFLVGVCSVAFRYDVGGMWPYLEKVFGPLPGPDQQTLSEAFRDALDQFGLSRFTFPRRNVDEILMHAGIPGQRMDEFIELLARRDAMTDGLDGRSFCQWVGGLSRQTAFTTHGLDAPTYRFLAEGRELAEDLVDRCLDLLDVWASSGVTMADVAGFPGVMQKDLVRALDELGEKQVASRSRPRSRQVDLVPRLTFSATSGIAIRLPPLEIITEARVEWLIAAEGTTSRRTVEPPWPGDPVRVGYTVVSRPSKQVALSALPGDQTWIVTVVDPDDPFLVFDGATGEWIPPRNTLPKSDAILALPNPDDLQLVDLVETDRNLKVHRLLESPMGWSDWTFAEVSLASISKIRRRDAEAYRYVSSVDRPTIELESPVHGVRGLDSAPVCAALPTIVIPAVVDSSGSGSSIEWTVTATRVDTGEVIRTAKVLATGDVRAVDLAEAGSAPLLGTIDFAVKGPLGRGTTRRLTIAEGLAIDAQPSFRSMSTNGDGLVPATVTVSVHPSVEAPARLALGPRDSTARFELVAERRLQLIVDVPAMSVTRIAPDGSVFTSHSPIAINLEELERMHLRVNFGAPGRAQLVALKGQELLQTVQAAAAGPTGAATFTLAQLADTLTGAGGASLLVGADGARIPVARVRPRQLVESVQVHADDATRLRLVGLATDQRLDVAMYPRYAPWNGPGRSRSDGDSVEIPSDLRSEGELRVLVRVEDPWVAAEWPREYPSRSFNVFDVGLGVLEDSRGGVDQGYRSWLKRTAPCPDDPASLALAIQLYSGSDLAKFRTPLEELRDEVGRAVRHNREFVPAAYSQAAVDTAPIDLFIASDIVTLPPAHYPHGASLWESSPLLAVLANSYELAAVGDDLDRVLGESSSSILSDGTDASAAQGRFGPNIEVLAKWPDDRIESVWRSVSPVPGRVLDAATRVIAAKQMFDRRRRLYIAYAEAAQLHDAARRVVARAFGDGALTPIAAREASAGWASLPAFTLSLSLVARAASRDVEGAASLYSLARGTLLGLARMSPKLVEQDLILAELWLTRWSTA